MHFLKPIFEGVADKAIIFQYLSFALQLSIISQLLSLSRPSAAEQAFLRSENNCTFRSDKESKEEKKLSKFPQHASI